MLDVFLMDQVVGDPWDFLFGLFAPWHVFVANEHLFRNVVLWSNVRLFRVDNGLHDVIWDMLFHVIGGSRRNQKQKNDKNLFHFYSSLFYRNERNHLTKLIQYNGRQFLEEFS